MRGHLDDGPVVRTRINLLLAELRATRGQLLAARHLANEHCTIKIEGDAVDVAQRTGADMNLTSMELRAFQAALSPETLEHWGWVVDDSGRVISESGQTVFNAGFANAVEKTLRRERNRLSNVI